MHGKDDIFPGTYLFGKLADDRLDCFPLQPGPYLSIPMGPMRPSYAASKLEELVKERDGVCVLSNAPGECICDIVPYGYSAIRRKLMGLEQDETGVTTALWLSRPMCDAFKNYDIAICASVRV